MIRWSFSRLLGSCLPGVLLITLAPASHAQSNAVTLNGGLIESAADNGDTSYSLGWSFTVDKPLSVTGLGFYDDNDEAAAGTAMTVSHPVGIFTQSDGTLVVQSTVSPTSTNTQALADGALFRYSTTLSNGSGTPIATFTLLPGVTYDIAGVTYGDYYEYLPDTFSTAADVSYIQDQYANGGNVTSLIDPTLSYGDNYGGIVGQGFFGPNFQFSPASTSTPEPSSIAGLGIGLLGLLGLGLRARRRRS